MLSYCVPLLNRTGCWRTWSIMKLQTTLAPDILHILLLFFSTILGVFWASYHISLCLTNLNQSPKNSIYPAQTTRPSGQTVGHRYSLTRYSKSCSIIIWSQGRSCVGDPKANIQHTQTHTSLQICSSNKKSVFQNGRVFHQHIISHKKFHHVFFALNLTNLKTLIPHVIGFPMGPGSWPRPNITGSFGILTPPKRGLGHFLLILSYRFFPWERIKPAKTAFRWKSLVVCLYAFFFWKSWESRNHKSCVGIKKSSWKICFFKSFMCW